MTKSFRKVNIVCIAMAATFFVAGSLSASLIHNYVDYNDWNSHLTNVASEVIEEPLGHSTYMQYAPGYSLEVGNAIFTQPDSPGSPLFFLVGSGFSGVPPIVTSKLDDGVTGVTNFQIDFGHDLNGFAINFGTKNGSTVNFELFNAAGDSVGAFSKGSTGGSVFNTTDFVGVTDTPFTRILITTTDQYLNLNKLHDDSPFNPPSVPEPSTIALLSLGGIGLAVTSCRRRKFAKK